MIFQHYSYIHVWNSDNPINWLKQPKVFYSDIYVSVVALCFLMKPDRNVRGMMDGYYVCSSTHQFSDPQTELTIQTLACGSSLLPNEA